MIFNYWREERNGGVPVVQLSLLSPLQNICPSNVAAAFLSPCEVACPAQDGQVWAGPGPSVIKQPSCAVTSGIEAGVIHDPVSAPSEGHTQTLTGQLRVKPCMEYLWRTTMSSPPRTLVGATSACLPTLLPKCRMGPHQPCQSIKRENITPPLLLCPVCLFKGELHALKGGQCGGRHFHWCNEEIKNSITTKFTTFYENRLFTLLHIFQTTLYDLNC